MVYHQRERGKNLPLTFKANTISSIATSSQLNSAIGVDSDGIHDGWSKFRGSAWYALVKNSVASASELNI